VSVINKMLQELDKRNAAAGGTPELTSQAVKPTGTARGGHEGFWRTLAVLVLISVAWVGWVAYQLQPRSIVTPLALKAAKGQIAMEPAPVPVAEAPKPAPVAEAPKPAPVVEAPKPAAVGEAPKPPAPVAEAPKPAPVAEKPKPAAETFKLARTIETPIGEPRAEPVAKPRPNPEAKVVKPKPEAVQPPPASKVVVDKRDRAKGVSERAEAHFRRAAAFLGQGRVSEAEEQLGAALHADAGHASARQVYVALLLEQQRVNSALQLLREGVEVSPSQPAFSLTLARIYVEQRDYPAALQVMDQAGAAAGGADFMALRGAVLQRLGRHDEAVGAYQKAVESAPHIGGSWTALGISLEALRRNAEAAQAYKRALGAQPLAPELRDYAQARIRALQ
jgi:MSHA biogenesis protein MshN